MTDLVSHVDAVYNGKRHRFELKRNHLAAFEAALGDSAYAAMRRFVDGTWRFRDVELTLSFAHSGATDAEEMLAAIMATMPDTSTAPFLHHTEFTVSRVLKKHGPATYAELAASVLVAALMGLQPEQAVFDDGSMEATK